MERRGGEAARRATRGTEVFLLCLRPGGAKEIFQGRRKHARTRVRRSARGCNELYFYRITARPRPAPGGMGGHAGSLRTTALGTHMGVPLRWPCGASSRCRALRRGDDRMNITFTSCLPARPRPAISPPALGRMMSKHERSTALRDAASGIAPPAATMHPPRWGETAVPRCRPARR